MTAYYNEIDAYAAQWLRNLIDAGHIPAGEVDTRSIVDVRSADLAGYTQCHFFAGVGGWPLALRAAGWPDDLPAWTGSCPCQPFSRAGKRAGFDDERHLWPIWFRLIRQCSPAAVLGEQVASASEWLAFVRSDLEALGYAVGAVPIEAASAGSFHFRDRYWIVADAGGPRLAKRKRIRRVLRQMGSMHEGQDSSDDSRVGGLVDPDGGRWEAWLDDTPAGHRIAAASDDGHGLRWLPCADGKARPIGSGIPLLAHGVPCYAPKLRGYGNAIDIRVAAEVIGAFMECWP